MRHIVQQGYQEKQKEDLEREKRESVRRTQAELPTYIINKPRRLIPVEPVISPFDSEENKVPEKDTFITQKSPEHPSSDSDSGSKDTPYPSPCNTPEGSPNPSPKHSSTESSRASTPTESPKAPDSLFIPRLPIPHRDSVSSESPIDSDTDLDMATTAATKDLIDALTRTLKNINQSPTIPLPVFKGKKEEDPEDHILKIEDYFELHQITEQDDKIKKV